jgi:hypothetical protein
LYNNIKQCKQLCCQEKFIFAEIISFIKAGLPFKMTDKRLAYNLAMDKGSVSKFVNQLAQKGAIDKTTECFPSLSGGKPKRLRTITVPNIESWIEDRPMPQLKELEKKTKKKKDKADEINPSSNASPLPKTDSPMPIINTDNAMAQPKVGGNAVPMEGQSSKPIKLENTHGDEISIGTTKGQASVKSNELPKVPNNGLKILDVDNDIDEDHYRGKAVIENIKNGTSYNVERVNIRFSDGSTFPDKAILVPNSGKYFVESRLKMIDPSIAELI